MKFLCEWSEIMKHIKTVTTKDLKKTVLTGGCGECQASCQTASKVDNTVTNQKCECK